MRRVRPGPVPFVMILALTFGSCSSEKPAINRSDAGRLRTGHDAGPPDARPTVVRPDATVAGSRPNWLDNSLEHPEHRSVYATRGPKTMPRVRWKVKTGYFMHNTPVVTDRFVLAGVYAKDLVAHDPATGDVRWRWKAILPGVRDSDELATCFKSVGHEYRPLFHDGLLYYQTCAGGLVAIDAATGALRWAHPLRARSRDLNGEGLAPFAVVSSDAVFGYAIEVADGWRNLSRVVSVNRDDGRLRWERRLEGWARNFALVGNRVLVATSRGLEALDARTGERLWRAEEPGPIRKEAARKVMRVVGKRVTFCVDGAPRICDLDTGRRLDTAREHCDVEVGELTVRYDAQAARLTVHSARDGSLRWERRDLYWLRDFTIADDVIYFAGTTAIHAFALRSGEVLWRFPTPLPLWTRPVPADGALYFTSRDEYLWKIQ